MNNDDLDLLNARISVLEVALAYTLTNLSAKFNDTKPAVIQALRRDCEINKENDRHNSAKALHDLANLIEVFKVTE